MTCRAVAAAGAAAGPGRFRALGREAATDCHTGWLFEAGIPAKVAEMEGVPLEVMLDTDCCVELLRGRAPRAVEALRTLGLGHAHVSTIAVGELLVGAERSSQPRENAGRVVAFCASLDVASFDDCAAALYAEIRATLESRGTPIGALDLLIAGHALAIGATLVTGNLRRFARVPGLACENWIARRR